MTYTIAVCTVKNSYDGQRNCPKQVEVYSKNKFEKLVQLVGFIIRIYHDARSPECQIRLLHISVRTAPSSGRASYQWLRTICILVYIMYLIM